MKKLFFFLLLLPMLGGAQSNKDGSFNLQAGGLIKPQQPRTGNGFSLGLQSIFPKNWTGSISFYTLKTNPGNLPSDYDAGESAGFVLFIPYYDIGVDPRVHLDLINLTAGKRFMMGKRSWWNLEGGLSFASGEKARFSRRPVETSSGGFLIVYDYSRSSNYTIERWKKSGLGALVKTDLTFLLGRHIGLSAGGFAAINPVQSPLGLEFKLSIGSFGIAGK